MKKWISLALALMLALTLSACGSSESGGKSGAVELNVFAAASMTETLDQIIDLYKAVDPNVVIIPNYDSSGTLLTQIKEGADCDLFISAAPKQMNALDGSLVGDADKNPDGLDLLAEGTRIDLLENKVTLVVPEGDPKGIQTYDQLARMLASGEVFLAMGNSDVPVGQYTQKIFAYYGLDEDALAAAGVLTYGSNVKEVTTHVSEGAVDCGIIYATDAFSARLTIVDEADEAMCGQVIYPAAVLNTTRHEAEAKAFLDYVHTNAEAVAVLEGVGFTVIP